MYSRLEEKQLKLDFWTEFANYSSQLKYLKRFRGKWMMYRTGVKQVELKFDVERYELRVALEVNHKSDDKRLEVYEKLEQYRKIFDATFGSELIWDYAYSTASGNDVCRIYTKYSGYDFHRRTDWQEMFKFMGENMIQLELAYKEIKDVLEPTEQE